MSKGSGTGSGYSIEIRQSPSNLAPVQVGKVTVDGQWRQLPTYEVPLGGVPTPSWDTGLQLAHLLSYQAAQSLRWWFHAQAHCGTGGGCIESRIIKHRITWSYSSERVSEHMPIGGEDRSNLVPDWGTPEVEQKAGLDRLMGDDA